MLFRLCRITFLLLPLTAVAAPEDFFGIHVVDEATGRGVPLITLKTTNQIALTTDSAGWIAFHEPGLMDRQIFFQALRAKGWGFDHGGVMSSFAQ